MAILKNIIMEEQQRLQELIDLYQREINQFPRGSVQIKNIHGKKYLYLAYRDNEKVKFEYIGPVKSDKSEKVMKQIEHRRSIEADLRKAKKELKEIERVLDGKKI